MTRPTRGSLPAFGRRAAPSLTQKREPVSYSVPHCGQTFGTAASDSGSGVGWRERRPDPNALADNDESSPSGSTSGEAELPLLPSPGAAGDETDWSSRSDGNGLSMISNTPRLLPAAQVGKAQFVAFFGSAGRPGGDL